MSDNEFDIEEGFQDKEPGKTEVEETIETSIEFETPVEEESVKEEKDEEESFSNHVFSSKGTPNATVTSPYSEQLTEEEIKKENDRMSLPNYPLDKFNEIGSVIDSATISLRETLEEWTETLRNSMDGYTISGLYQDRFVEEGSEFNQGVKDNSGNLNGISPLKFKETTGEIKGELALLKVSKFLGLGEILNVPLPHSGIWVTIKPPTEKALIDFYNTVFREKQILGRLTAGYTLSNMSVHINNRLFDFILNHIHSVNYKDISKEDLKNKILIHDFPILAWAFMCSIYPNGFEYQRACMNDPEACSHIEKARLNLDKLLWVDDSVFTEYQRNTLGENRPNRLTLDSYNRFIAEHTRVASSTYTSPQGIKFKLRVPTFSEWVTDGLRWVNSISNMVESALIGANADEDTRIETLNQYVSTSILNQYNHFIEYIEIGPNTVTDRTTIGDVLDNLSADDTVREGLTEAIIRFKSKTTVGLIGIPEYKCKSCGHLNTSSNDDLCITTVIPLDVVNLCFLMLTSRISQIVNRQI